MPAVCGMRPCWKCGEQVTEDQTGPGGCDYCTACRACEGSGVGYVVEPPGWWHGSGVNAVELRCCVCDGSGDISDDQGSCLDRGLGETEMCPKCLDAETDRKVAERYATRDQVTAPSGPEDDPWNPIGDEKR